MTKYYNCEFLSDVVLQASANTQGNVLLSDFIPGSNFLGMVAANGGYESFGEDAFDVFHSGAVKFGDGHLVISGDRSHKIPLCFFDLKVGEGIFNRLFLEEEEEERLRHEHKQLKQIRTGYMNRKSEYAKPLYTYAQKSKHNREYRRSDDGGMYGYSALRRGSNWIFPVTYSDEKYIAGVEEKLFAASRLGKSKSAQYGKIKITPLQDEVLQEHFEPTDNMTYLYADARLALIDGNGMPTYLPTIENLGLKSGCINWEKTQIRTVAYQPYNYVRKTKEYTRVALGKGSVIAIEGLDSNEKIPEYMGAYTHEGFGRILVNPKFLEARYPKLEKVESITAESKVCDHELVAYLKKKVQKEEDTFAVASSVEQAIPMFKGPSPSQWGQIRIMATTSKTKEELMEKITDFIGSGKSKKQWEGIEEKLLAYIQNHPHPIAFTKLLSMMMPKQTRGGK